MYKPLSYVLKSSVSICLNAVVSIDNVISSFTYNVNEFGVNCVLGLVNVFITFLLNLWYSLICSLLNNVYKFLKLLTKVSLH